MSEQQPDANTFTVRVICGNCRTEYDQVFVRGTMLDDEGWSDSRHLVDTSNRRFTNGMSYVPAVPVLCLQCGVAALNRIRRTA